MRNEEKIDSFVEKIEPYLIVVIIASFVGITGGVLGALLIKTIDIFTNIRNAIPYVILAMPLIGMLIVYLNKTFNTNKDGREIINKAITKEEDIDDYMVPSMFVTTTLSHLAGAAVGRMEAPIKMGGGIGTYISKFFSLKKKNRATIIASGVAALFASVFGAPFTGTIFAYELCFSKNQKKPIYILPVLLAAAFSRFICFALGANSFIDNLIYIHHAEYGLKQIIPILLLIGICLIFALIFNKIQDGSKKLFSKIKNEYVRIVIGSLIMIGCIYLIGNTLFCGNDTSLVEKALNSNTMWYTFILKAVLTSLCLAIGFKGGNIGPAFISGAALGILLSTFMGIDPQMGAAIGSITLFGGVTGCFISLIALGIEIFGLKSIIFFIIIALFIRYFIKQNIIQRNF